MTQKQQLECMIEGFKRVIRSFRDELPLELLQSIQAKLDNEFEGCIKPRKISRRKDKLLATSKLPFQEGREYTTRVLALANRLIIVCNSNTYQIHKPQDYKDLPLNKWITTKLKLELYKGKRQHSNRIYGRLHRLD